MPTQEERRATTTAAIHAAARRLFAERGFAATSIDDIAAEAGVTKGGVYHHFETKERLFEDVFRAVEEDLHDSVVHALPATGSSVDLLVAGVRAFVDCCLVPEVNRIVLVDGPAVLGWKVWRQIDAEHFLALMAAGLAAGAPPGADVTPVAHLLMGAVDEAVMLLAAEADPPSAAGPIADALEVVVRAVAERLGERGQCPATAG